MLLIPCPWCGPRVESEFTHGGEADVARPKDPDAASNDVWLDYLYFRRNPKGVFDERWLHAGGCRQWFIVSRDTRTNQFQNSMDADERDR